MSHKYWLFSSIALYLSRTSSFRQTFVVLHIRWSLLADRHHLSLSNCHHGYHKANGLFPVLLSGLLLPYAKMVPDTARPPFSSQTQGPARNTLIPSCADRAHASISLGKEERLAPSPRCFAHRWLSKALSSRSLLHSITGYYHLDLLQTRVWWFLEGDCGLRGWKGVSQDRSLVELAPAWGCITTKAAFPSKSKPIWGSSWRKLRVTHWFSTCGSAPFHKSHLTIVRNTRHLQYS